MFRILTLSILVLLASSCVSKNTRPAWVDNPGSGFVGKCGTHVRGVIYQEECAFKKGLTYMAMSKGVKASVIADIDMKQTSSGRSSSNRGSLEAKLNIGGEDISLSGTIKDKWHDKNKDIIYVWIQE